MAARLEYVMLMSQVRDILTFAINEPCPALNLIAFHRGDLVPDWLLARAIDAAHRGHITAHGKRLYLIPTRVYEQANRDSIARIKAKPRKKNDKGPNLTPWPEVQKRDCIPLPNYLPKNTAQLKARISQYYVSNPHEQRAPKELKATLIFTVVDTRITLSSFSKCASQSESHPQLLGTKSGGED